MCVLTNLKRDLCLAWYWTFLQIITTNLNIIWVKVFKNVPSKICGRQQAVHITSNFFKGCLPQILLGPFLNTLTQIWYWQNPSIYQTFQLWVGRNCVNGAENLDFVISSAIKKCKCINNLMLILCLQRVTLLKVRLRHRSCLANFANFFSLQLY